MNFQSQLFKINPSTKKLFIEYNRLMHRRKLPVSYFKLSEHGVSYSVREYDTIIEIAKEQGYKHVSDMLLVLDRELIEVLKVRKSKG